MIIAETGSMSYWRKGTGQVIYFLKNVPFFPIKNVPFFPISKNMILMAIRIIQSGFRINL
jgi:hypothetical protein